MKLFLLPAFDGTGTMFAALSKALGNAFTPISVAYPETGPQDYLALTEVIRRQLPEKENYMILGESFAGPIIYQLAINAPKNCKAAVFVATYLSNPQPLFLKILSLLPASILSRFVSTAFVIKWLALGRQADPAIADAIAKNFGSVKPHIIKQRLIAIGSLNNKPNQTLDTPCFYIQANQDKLVLKDKLPDFERLCHSLTIIHAEGGHFILQENPHYCAEILRKHLLNRAD